MLVYRFCVPNVPAFACMGGVEVRAKPWGSRQLHVEALRIWFDIGGERLEEMRGLVRDREFGGNCSGA